MVVDVFPLSSGVFTGANTTYSPAGSSPVMWPSFSLPTTAVSPSSDWKNTSGASAVFGGRPRRSTAFTVTLWVASAGAFAAWAVIGVNRSCPAGLARGPGAPKKTPSG